MDTSIPRPADADNPRTIADWVVADLALAEAVLIERIASLDADVAIYKELLCATFDALRDLTRRHDRLVCERARLRDELRALREHCLLRAGADAGEPT